MKSPSAWSSAFLRDVSDDISYGYTASAVNSPVGPKLLRITDIQDGKVNWDTVPYCECDRASRFQLIAGDIVVARTGATTGKSFLISEAPPSAVFASYLIRVRPSRALDARFLAAFMQSPMYWQHITTVSKGTAQPGANASLLGDLSVPVPPFGEQHRIVRKLQALQARSRRAREALEEVPGLLEKLRQSILAAAFRGDLTKEWRAKNPDVEPAEKLLQRIRAERRKKWEESELARLLAKGKPPPDDRWKAKYEAPAPIDTPGLPSLPHGWTWAAWREVGFCQNGRAFPSAEYCEDGTKLLRPGNLHVSGHLEWTKENTRRMPERWAMDYPEFIVGANELVINLTAQSLKDEFLGRVCMTEGDERCLLNQRLARLTPVALPLNYWLYLFKSSLFRRYVDTLNTGSLIQHMFTSQIDACPVPLMPLAESQALAKKVDSYMRIVHRAMPLYDEETRRLQELDRAILAKAFRGELVPQDPADEPAAALLARLKSAAAPSSDTPASPPPGKRRGRPRKS